MWKNYKKLIAAHDSALHILQDQWAAAKDKNEAALYMERINDILDSRARLMRLRDAPPKDSKSK